MANPQPEPFVKFSKELLDALLLSSMPSTHKEIVLAVIRKTYGDRGKKQAPISQSLLRRMTGRSEGGIRKCLAELKSEGVIVEVTEATWTEPAVLSLNKDYEKWGKWSVGSVLPMRDPQENTDPPPNEGGSYTGVRVRTPTTVTPLKTSEEDTSTNVDASKESKQSGAGLWVQRWIDARTEAGLPRPSKAQIEGFGRHYKQDINKPDDALMRDTIRRMAEQDKEGWHVHLVYRDCKAIAEREMRGMGVRPRVR